MKKFVGIALAIGGLAFAGPALAGSPSPMALPQVVCGAPGTFCGSPNLIKTNQSMTITPAQATTWATMKSALGPTYTGGPGGAPWESFVHTQMQVYGAQNIYTQALPYNLYTVNDWPNPLTHIFGSGVETEKMISNGTPVPTVASYVTTSGATPTTGLTAPMVFCPTTVNTAATVTTTCPGSVAGKIVVCAIPNYPPATPGVNGPYSYTSGILGLYAYTDAGARYESTPPGNFPLWTAVPPTVQTSHYYRWNFTMLSGCISQAKAGNAAGMVEVMDVSPGGAFGLLLREVYNASGSPAAGGPGTVYQNIPSLILDRVNGAKVLTDAQAGATATIWLLPQGVTNSCASTASTVNGSAACGFVSVTGNYFVGYLPGKYYGTPQDQWINIATHTDAQSLVEEDGSLGMLSMMYYFNQIPQSQRPKTLEFWFDSRHFMPGAEGQWSVYDYFNLFPALATNRVAYMSLEHMGGRATQETGTPDGLSVNSYPTGFIGADTYSYINAAPEDGGDIDALLTSSNNNIWAVNATSQAAQDNNWVRMFVNNGGGTAPGIAGGFVKSVNSAELKGSPGIGLAGDWPGNWTQSYSQYTTEAGCPTPTTCGSVPGFDANYFTATSNGMTEIAGEMMAQTNLVIVWDAGWGSIDSGLTCTSTSICTSTPTTGQLPNTQFVTPANATTQRATLVSQYQTAFQYVQQGQYRQAINALQTLEQEVTSWISNPNATALNVLIGNQITKLLALPQVYTHDVNGDGLSDVLWRDASGNVGTWLMNSTSILQGSVLGGTPLNWSIVGQRDFNGDGNSDVLWRDTSGNLGMWLMNGSAIASSTVLGNVPNNWSVAGTGDFNGDGLGDILWRDTSGNVGIWLMNGTKVVTTATVGNVPTNWVIAGSDMHGDIFWRNTTTGEVGMWVMNGTKISKTVDFGVVPLTWNLVGIGDFDNNGSTDMLWRDTSGNIGIWLMNGTTILSTAVVGNLPVTQTIAQTGDFNGDGKTDIMFVDNTGNVGVWFMDGTAMLNSTTYGNVGTSWTIQALNAE